MPEARESMSDKAFATLNEEQRQRVAALYVSRDVLANRGPFLASNVSSSGAIDLYSLAVYIVRGNDPWATTSLPEMFGGESSADG